MENIEFKTILSDEDIQEIMMPSAETGPVLESSFAEYLIKLEVGTFHAIHEKESKSMMEGLMKAMRS